MLWFDDTARNSNLLPVKANGLVRLRSPASRGSFGSTLTPMSMMPPLLVRLGAARLLDLLEDVGQHVAEEDRDDRRRRFVGAEAVIVAGAGDAEAQQPLELVDGAQHGGAEHQELDVVVRRVAGVQQVVAQVVAHAPVVVLAGAVDAGERLLVQQARQAVLRRRSAAASPSSSSGDRWRRWRSRRSARLRTGSARLRCGAS